MSVGTSVFMMVRNDLHSEVLDALRSVDPQLFQVSVSSSNDPEDTTELQVSLAGDVSDEVKDQLAAFPDLECEVEVMDSEDP
ncbi:hypothetical protein AB0N62_39340 [Streptomyces sp. NPDC093982]|uniref:hypothetical protein n=1 Tax=Streptomyces sp. NPDC093982 TaxID=3155077 RepID=UPI003415F686